MNELIKVESRNLGEDVVQTVNARELHGFLESKRQFANWIQERIQQYGFVEGVDFTVNKFVIGRATQIDYHLTLDMAKELSMVERNEKGKQARQYFLTCEKRLKSIASVPQVPQTLPEALRLAADLAEKNAQQAVLIEEQKPSVEFVQKYAEAESTKCLGDVAKVLGHKPHAFSKRLAEDNVIFKRDGVWIPKQVHVDAGRFTVRVGVRHGFAFNQIRVTPKGVVWLAQKYGE